MARHFRCEEPNLECPHARTRAVQADGPGVCPIDHPDCARWRRPVSLFTALRERFPFLVPTAASVLALVVLVILLSALLGGGGWRPDLAGLQADLGRLDGRLTALEEQVPQTGPPTDPRVWTDLLGAAQGLDRAANQAAATGGVANEPALRAELARLDGQLSRLLATTGTDTRVATSARQLVRDYQDLETRVEEGRNLAPAGDEDADMAFADLIEELRDGLGRAGRLARATPTSAPPPQAADIQTALQRAGARLGQLAQRPHPPFAVDAAGLSISTTPVLAQSLVLPLLQARLPDSAVTAEPDAGRWFVATTDPGLAPGVVVSSDAATEPYGPLFDANTDLGTAPVISDLVITDRAPDAAVRERFAGEFDGRELNSRAFSEVIALDAVALLAHPDAVPTPVDASGLATAPWLTRAAHTEAMRMHTPDGLTLQDVADPLQALLQQSDARALMFYHETGPSPAARFLPLQPTADARALAASPFTIATEDYGLAFRVIAAHTPRARATARQFIDYLTSDAGQDHIAAAGFVDLRLRHGQEPVAPIIQAVLAQALGVQSITSASRYSTNLRFGVDRHRLDIKAQADLGRLPRSLAQDFPNGKVVILGFTDGTGSAEHNHGLSIKRAEFIAGELKPFGIAAAATGLGQQLPLDTNDTDAGRARNRRAEVWVVNP